jgi:hypothetical protein
MAITHHFSDAGNLAAGAWKHDFGQMIGTWTWDAATRELTVKVDARGKRFDLSRHGEQNFTAVKLRERLPRLAIEAAEEIDEAKYDV